MEEKDISDAMERLFNEGAHICEFFNRAIFFSDSLDNERGSSSKNETKKQREAREKKQKYFDEIIKNGSPLSICQKFRQQTGFIKNQLIHDFPNGNVRCREFALEINSKYYSVVFILAERLANVTRKYQQQRAWRTWKIFKKFVPNAERDMTLTLNTGPTIVDNLKKILDDIKSNLEYSSFDPTSEGYPIKEWRIVRNGGSVLMEEIAFLRARIDHFNTLRNALWGFTIALAGFIINLLKGCDAPKVVYDYISSHRHISTSTASNFHSPITSPTPTATATLIYSLPQNISPAASAALTPAKQVNP